MGRIETRERVEEILDVLHAQAGPFSGCSYESSTVAMLFFSRTGYGRPAVRERALPCSGGVQPRREQSSGLASSWSAATCCWVSGSFPIRWPHPGPKTLPPSDNTRSANRRSAWIPPPGLLTALSAVSPSCLIFVARSTSTLSGGQSAPPSAPCRGMSLASESAGSTRPSRSTTCSPACHALVRTGDHRTSTHFGLSSSLRQAIFPSVVVPCRLERSSQVRSSALVPQP